MLPSVPARRRKSLRTHRVISLAGELSDPRVLAALALLAARPHDDAALARQVGIAPALLDAAFGRLTTHGLVKRVRGRWRLAGGHVAAWLAQGIKLANSLRDR